jgi:hypothetical protein
MPAALGTRESASTRAGNNSRRAEGGVSPRFDDIAFYTQLGAATLPRIADLAIARALGESDAARGERRARTRGPDPAACDDVV